MIRGIGLDIVALGSFREQLADPASTFVEGTFTAGERREARTRADGDVARHLAARFAAKEALIKAWAAGNFGGPPVVAAPDLREIEVVSDAWGRPAIRLYGAVAAAVGEGAIHLSISHDGDVVVAVVILERSQGSSGSDMDT